MISITKDIKADSTSKFWTKLYVVILCTNVHHQAQHYFRPATKSNSAAVLTDQLTAKASEIRIWNTATRSSGYIIRACFLSFFSLPTFAPHQTTLQPTCTVIPPFIVYLFASISYLLLLMVFCKVALLLLLQKRVMSPNINYCKWKFQTSFDCSDANLINGLYYIYKHNWTRAKKVFLAVLKCTVVWSNKD